MVDAFWAAWDGRGLEHLRLEMAPSIRADSLIVAIDAAGRPFRARFVVECDEEWKVARARMELLGEPGRVLELSVDRRRQWTEAAAGRVPSLDGCVDIDIYPSPFTNTLPMRRLADAPAGRPVAIDAAWVALPELTVQPARQEYTLVERGPGGARWRFRALDSDFAVELATDPQGLVLDYPGIARRIL